VAVDKLKDWLWKAKTNPQLVEAIVGGLQGWYSGADLHLVSEWPAFIQQCSLGWNTFLEGELLGLWRQEQDNFWKRIKTQKSSKQWMLELIKKLWAVSWDFCSHQNMELHLSAEACLLIIEADTNRRVEEAFLGRSSGLPRDAARLLQ